MAKIMMNRLEQPAMHVLQILHPDASNQVIARVFQSAPDGPISKETVLNCIVAVGGRTVSGIRKLVKPDLVFGVDIESKSVAQGVKRTTQDIRQGISNSAFCLDLAHDLFHS